MLFIKRLDHPGKIKFMTNDVIYKENGETELGPTYYAYGNETYKDAMEREAREKTDADISSPADSGFTYPEGYEG
jgi:ADP-ribose pyrophosphatase YjhB (NUDIX family)